MLRKYLQSGTPRWQDVYDMSCKEENMSVKTERIHPDLNLRPPPAQAGRSDENDAIEDCIIVGGGGSRSMGPPFSFELLPMPIQARIWRLWLFFEGQLIHALSRFDPFAPPESMPPPERLEVSTGLPHLFVWGKRAISIDTDGKDPNDVLRLLLVSRSFYYTGVHAFYGLNTFAFSSLGELGRFAQGIGEARWDRVQHIELMFQGGKQEWVIPPDRVAEKTAEEKLVNLSFSRRRGRNFGRHQNEEDEVGKKHLSPRWYPLTHLLECRRLSTLVVHVDETGKSYIRRRYEPDWYKQIMRNQTNGQPDNRDTRALRNLQGADVFYALRGLHTVQFYDFAKALASAAGSRVPVRD